MNIREMSNERVRAFLRGCANTLDHALLPKDLFKAYYGFLTDALSLIQEHFTEKELQFYEVIEAAREKELTPVLSKLYMDALGNYREYEHGLKWGTQISNERDAITSLFSFALAARVRIGNSESISCVWREIEGFADVYFQFFNHVSELVDLFHANVRGG